jgi:hypothetical protein
MLSFRRFVEDASAASALPVNNIGSGAIEGAGVGPNGEPGVYRRRRNMVMTLKPLKRKMPDARTTGTS